MLLMIHPPLQLIDLFILVILLIFHLPKDLQQPVNLSLGLPRVLFVAGHFLLEALNALRHLGVGLSLQGRILGLTTDGKIHISDYLHFHVDFIWEDCTLFSWFSHLRHSSLFCSKAISRLFSLESFFRPEEARDDACSFRSNKDVCTDTHPQQ